LRSDPVMLQPVGNGAGEVVFRERAVDAWWRLWLKGDANLLARAAEASGEAPAETAPLAAAWRRGAGQAVATAMPLRPDEADRLAKELAGEVGDPRFVVEIDSAAENGDDADALLRARVRANEAGRPMNDLPLRMM